MTKNIATLRKIMEHCHALEGGDETYTLVKCMTRGLRELTADEVKQVQRLIQNELNSGCEVNVRKDQDQPYVLSIVIENFTPQKLHEMLQALQNQETPAATSN